jgi:hypothetical protein
VEVGQLQRQAQIEHDERQHQGQQLADHGRRVHSSTPIDSSTPEQQADARGGGQQAR